MSLSIEEFKKKYEFSKNMELSDIQKLSMFMVTCMMEINILGPNNETEPKLSLFLKDLPHQNKP